MKLVPNAAVAMSVAALLLSPLIGQAQTKVAKKWYLGHGKWEKKLDPEPVPDSIRKVSAEDLKAKLDKKAKFLLVDSRNAEEYKESHIPKAVHLYDEDMEKSGKKKLPKEKASEVVFYCNGYPSCPRSLNGAKIAQEWGYTNVHIFLGGMPEWNSKGFPAERSR